MILGNLLAYSGQIAALTAAGALVAALLRRSTPGVRLLHWQMLLAACLLLPFVERWKPLEDGVVTVVMGAATTVTSPAAQQSLRIPWDTLLPAVLMTGMALFLARLALGSWRIHLYRRRSTPLAIGTEQAEFRVSDEITGPITFGWRNPVVLLPRDFQDLSPALQSAICEHELTHVRRGDWLFAVGEEIIRAVLWFHPAIWFLLGRIHLTREQVVDQQVVTVTGNKEVYLQALLAIAGLKSPLDFVPAPLFLRKRHLAERVATILNEVYQMNRKRMLLSLGLSSATLFITAMVASYILPLRANAQTERSTNGSPGQVKSGPQCLYKVPAQYPPDAKLRRIEGVVTLDASIDARGLVTEARVLSGPDELRRSAVQAVLQWQFAPSDSPTRAEVELNFRLSKGAPPEREIIGVLKKIEFVGVPEELKARIAPRIPVKEGETLTHDAPVEIQRAVAEVDPAVNATLTADNVLRISVGLGGIRIGGNVQATKLVKQVVPVYPPLAKQARIQGVVRFQVRIEPDGKVGNLQLVSGHPLLVPAATEALRQWEYQKTLLNGDPVAVLTMVDINFTLSDGPPQPPPAAAGVNPAI